MKQETDGSIEKGKDRVHVTRKGYRRKRTFEARYF